MVPRGLRTPSGTTSPLQQNLSPRLMMLKAQALPVQNPKCPPLAMTEPRGPRLTNHRTPPLQETRRLPQGSRMGSSQAQVQVMRRKAKFQHHSLPALIQPHGRRHPAEHPPTSAIPPLQRAHSRLHSSLPQHHHQLPAQVYVKLMALRVSAL
mmetsp:Transcript_18110/g.50673  ORF Transcript_18110/g.50673 Transcript_18110/m.50673 type:complete len:152 (-) Transcript_18110:1530-1985(-)